MPICLFLRWDCRYLHHLLLSHSPNPRVKCKVASIYFFSNFVNCTQKMKNCVKRNKGLSRALEEYYLWWEIFDMHFDKNTHRLKQLMVQLLSVVVWSGAMLNGNAYDIAVNSYTRFWVFLICADGNVTCTRRRNWSVLFVVGSVGRWVSSKQGLIVSVFVNMTFDPLLL